MRTLLFVGCCCAGVLGCGKSGPTYNEALQAYNNEVQVLDRLNAEYQAQLSGLDSKVEELEAKIKKHKSDMEEWVNGGAEKYARALAVNEESKSGQMTEEETDRAVKKVLAKVEEFSKERMDTLEALIKSTLAKLEKATNERGALVASYESKLKEQEARVDEALAIKEKAHK